MVTKKYDDASWHYEGNYPDGMPTENAATHIGMFLAWCIINNMMSNEHLDDFDSDIEEVKARRMTGAKYLISICDEKLYEEDLSKTENGFTKAYYGHAKQTKFEKAYANYLNDYSRILCGGLEGDVYRVADTWENYDKLSLVINQRFKEWQEFSAKK